MPCNSTRLLRELAITAVVLAVLPLFRCTIVSAGEVNISERGPYVDGLTSKSGEGAIVELVVSTDRNVSWNTAAGVIAGFSHSLERPRIDATLWGFSVASNQDTIGSDEASSASAFHSFTESFTLDRPLLATLEAGFQYFLTAPTEFNTSSLTGSMSISGPAGLLVSYSFESALQGVPNMYKYLEGRDFLEEVVFLQPGNYSVDYSVSTAATGRLIYPLWATGSAAEADAFLSSEVAGKDFGAHWSSNAYFHAEDEETSVSGSDFTSEDVPYAQPNYKGSFDFDFDETSGNLNLKATGEMTGRFEHGKLALGGKYDLQVAPGSGTTVATIIADSTFTDNLYLSGQGVGQIPVGPLLFGGVFDWELFGSLIDATHMMDLEIEVFATQPNGDEQSARFSYSRAYDGNPNFQQEGLQRFELEVPLDGREAIVNLGLRLNGRFETQEATLGVTVDVSDTVLFDSITFADGTTPESLGYQIMLGSGLPSPNLAVPEPAGVTSALALLTAMIVSRGPGHRRPRQVC